ncbi:MAG: WD40 repeat domain-containing protein, partial [Longimicrobiales bacterium]
RFDSAGLRLAAIDRAGGLRWLVVRDCSTEVASTEMSAAATALSADLSSAIALDFGPPEVRLFDRRTRETAVHDVTDANGFLLSALGVVADTFAIGVQDGAVLLWSASAKRTVRTPLRAHRSDVTALAFDAASRTLASGSITGEVILWDIDRAAPVEPVRTLPIVARNVTFTMDGRSLLVVDESGAARLWDVASLEPAAELPPWPALRPVAVSALAERFATLTGDAIVVRGWRDGASIDSVAVASSAGTWFALSPDGSLLGYVDKGHVLLRDLRTHATDTVALQASGSGAIAFSVAGDALLSAAKGDTVISYDMRTRGVTRVAMPGDKGPVQSVARRDALLATGGNIYDGNVLLWDVPSRSVVRTLSSGELLPIAMLLFSPEGGTIGVVSSAAESLYLWDVATGQQTLGPVSLEGRAGESLGVAFNPDGSLLATVERGGIVLRELDAARWAAAICRSVNRDLTLEEWRSYVGPYDFVSTCSGASAAAPSDPARPADRRQ